MNIHLFRIVLVLGILVYYGFLSAKVNGKVAALLTSKLSFGRKYSHFEITSTLRLASSGLQQALFFCLLILIGPLVWKDFIPQDWNPLLLVLAIPLGIGEMALASFICSLLMRLAKLLVPNKVPLDNEEWYVISSGGWMRSFRNAVKILPKPLSFLLILLYIFFEEAVFRGLVINSFRDYGLLALIPSTGLFVLVQSFNTPDWKNAMFPIIGSLVMGITHGYLYLIIPDIFPLILAHYITFVAASFRASNT